MMSVKYYEKIKSLSIYFFDFCNDYTKKSIRILYNNIKLCKPSKKDFREWYFENRF